MRKKMETKQVELEGIVLMTSLRGFFFQKQTIKRKENTNEIA
jgi:hypothetical protein